MGYGILSEKAFKPQVKNNNLMVKLLGTMPKQTKTKKLNKGWEREFDKKFNGDETGYPVNGSFFEMSGNGLNDWNEYDGDEIKSFIHSLLKAQKSQNKKVDKDWIERDIEDSVKKTAKHIGIISEGAIQTLWEEAKSQTLQALKKEVEGMKKKIKTLDPYDQAHLVRANIENKKKRSSNYALSQVIKLIEKTLK